MSRNRALIVYVILAATFLSLLATTMDRHFDLMVTERIQFPGQGGFMLARVFSPVLVRAIHSTGLSARVSALIHIGVFTVLTLFAYAAFLGDYGVTRGESGYLAAPAILIPMIWNYVILSSAHYIDDIPAVFFFIAGLILLKRRPFSSLLFNIVFAVAFLNRESAVFLIPAMFLLHLKKRKLIPLTLHCVALTATAYLVRIGLIRVLSSDPTASSPMFVNTLRINVSFLLTMFSGNAEALRMLMTFGGLWVLLPFCLPAAGSELRKLTVLLPVFFAGMLVAGSMNDEARIFNEMIPVVLSPCIASAAWKRARSS